MAIVTQTELGVLRQFPFAGLSDKPRERSDVPRASLIFDFRSIDIAAVGAGDEQRFRLNCLLPRNFAYVLTDFFWGMSGVTPGATNNWDNLGNCNYNNATSPSTNREYTMFTQVQSLGQSLTFDVLMKSWRWIGDLPTLVVQTVAGAQAQCVFEFRNPVEDDQAYSGNGLVRFLVYDIAQTHHWQPNSPTLTR